MTPGVCLLLSVAWLALTTVASLGSILLKDFSRHELENYCRSRQRKRFHEILAADADIATGALYLKTLGVLGLAVCGVQWSLAESSGGGATKAVLLWVGGAIVLAVMTLWIPMAITRVCSAPVLYHTWPLWQVLGWTMTPLVAGVELTDSLFRRLLARPKQEDDEEEAFEEEIRTIVTAGLQDGLLEEDAREMIEGVIELGDADVSDIMTPRNQVDAIDINLPRSQILAEIVRMRRTRIPVYDESLDAIKGVLFVKDLLPELAKPNGEPQPSLTTVLRDPPIVPDTKPVDALLRDFLRTRDHLAIVIDENDRVAGVVTIEDALEEIVGEIVDEYDPDTEANIFQTGQAKYEARGRAHLDELNEQFGLGLPEPSDIDTIGGLVVSRCGEIPAEGNVVIIDGLQVTVLKASKRRVERVGIELIDRQERELQPRELPPASASFDQ